MCLAATASVHAQAIPTQRPGTVGTGNLMLPVLAVYNSQYSDFKGEGSQHPWSPFGRGFTPLGGYVYQRGSALVLVNDGGYEVTFRKSGDAYVSDFQRNGDLTRILQRGSGYDVVYPDSSVVAYGHVHAGRAHFTSSRDADGRVRASMSWTTGTPRAFTNEHGWTTSFSVNERRLVSEVRFPQGVRYQFEYSDRDELTRVAIGKTEVAALRYDAGGDLIEFRDARGRSIFFAYSKGNELTGIGDGTTNKLMSYKGNVITTDTNRGSVVPFERETFRSYGNAILLMRHAWGPSSATGKSIDVLSLERDSNANVRSVTDYLKQTTKFSRNSVGLVTSVKHPTGTKDEFRYDEKNRVKSHATLLPSGGLIGTATFAYDSAGREVSQDVQDAKGRTVGSWRVERRSGEIVTTKARTSFFSYNPSGPKGEVVGVSGPMFVHSRTIDSRGLPTKIVNNGVQIDIVPILNTDGSTKITAISGNFSRVIEIDSTGSKVSETFGDVKGAFVQSVSGVFNDSALTPSSSVTFETVVGDLSVGRFAESKSSTTNGTTTTQRSCGLIP